MKYLALIRHAEAIRSPFENDFERKLTALGRIQAKEAGLCIKEKGNGEIILASDSSRTKDTALIISEINPALSLIFNHNIYNATINELLDVVSSISDDFSSAIIVGHNPSISELAEFLEKKDEAGAINYLNPAQIVFMKSNIDSWGLAQLGSFQKISSFEPQSKI